MDYVIAICGFLGGWLLVAGPLYQAALELREQEIDREQIEAAASTVPVPPKLSLWWWLLPPVAYIVQRRRSMAYRRSVVEVLSPEQLAQTVAFLNKARGWLIVASGAFLLALKETWELRELLDWPVLVFWVLVVVAAGLCVGNVVVTMAGTARALKRDEADALRRPGARGART